MSQDSLRALAEETGGFAAVNTNQFATAFDRIVSDNSSYYVLAYYPPTDKKDGKFHRIEVKVTRPGLTVRARRGYMAPKAKPAPKTTSKDGPSPRAGGGAQQPPQRQRARDAHLRGAVQGDRAERVGAARRRGASGATSRSDPTPRSSSRIWRSMPRARRSARRPTRSP